MSLLQSRICSSILVHPIVVVVVCPELVANFESLISLEIGNASPAKRHNIIFSDRRLENAHYRRFMDDLLAFAQPARFSSDHTCEFPLN